MASGFGNRGGPGRCHSFYVDFSQCMIHTENPRDCSLLRDDYFECLHHKKEFTRRNEVASHLKNQHRGVVPEPVLNAPAGGGD
mmetsp:Transcript_14342/g.17713  ORF Transcript_14342/g.17713 Transcript_14342/m.17713 type:complete len:83 (+) Transcript_14342:154-402(+)